jgi:hypothetical protein
VGRHRGVQRIYWTDTLAGLAVTLMKKRFGRNVAGRVGRWLIPVALWWGDKGVGHVSQPV